MMPIPCGCSAGTSSSCDCRRAGRTGHHRAARVLADPSFFAVACGTAIFVFYRIRIVPEHFWVTRRYLPIVLPAVLLGIATTLLLPLAGRAGWGTCGPGKPLCPSVGGSRAGGLGVLGRNPPVRPHVEYAGIIPRLEALAARFSPTDLVIVESRNASDIHVLASAARLHLRPKPVLS